MLPRRVDYRITFELMIWSFQWKKTQHESISDIGNRGKMCKSVNGIQCKVSNRLVLNYEAEFWKLNSALKDETEGADCCQIKKEPV